MNGFLKDWGWVIVVATFVFLTKGKPDLWDRLHDRAMVWASAQECKQ